MVAQHHGGSTMPATVPPPAPSATVVTTTLDGPLGPLTAGATDAGICLLEFTGPRSDAQTALLARQIGADLTPGRHPWLDRLREELDDYFAGRLTRFTVPVVCRGTPFQERVWRELLRIPYA